MATEFQSYLFVARSAAFKAGEIIRDGFNARSSLAIEKKGINDWVSNIDLESERAAIAQIRSSFQSDQQHVHVIVAEETGEKYSAVKARQPNTVTWIIDPLDGTRNFILGIPYFSVSIAVQLEGETIVGIVYNPVTDEMFVAEKGAGARFIRNSANTVGKGDQQRIRLKPHESRSGFTGKVLVTGFAFKTPEKLERQHSLLGELLQRGIGDIRRTGAAALDLCNTALGLFEGYYEEGIFAWDIAAGALVVTEAGGQVMDFNGGNNYLESGEIVAGDISVCREVVKLIHQVNRKLNN